MFRWGLVGSCGSFMFICSHTGGLNLETHEVSGEVTGDFSNTGKLSFPRIPAQPQSN